MRIIKTSSFPHFNPHIKSPWSADLSSFKCLWCSHMIVGVSSDDSENLLLLDVDDLSMILIFAINCRSLLLNFSPRKAYSTGFKQLWSRARLWVTNMAWSTAVLAGHWYSTIFALKNVSTITTRWYGVQQSRKARTTNMITFMARWRWNPPRMWRRRWMVIP